jgi:hypothetical protein
MLVLETGSQLYSTDDPFAKQNTR